MFLAIAGMSGHVNDRQQADSLKTVVLDKSKNVSEVCVSRQKLEDLYRRVLLLDLEYALDRKVEQDLWNNGFKNQINTLQTQSRDRQNVRRTEAQASLNLFLEMASGFYLQTQSRDRQNVRRTEAQASLNLFLEMASGFYLQLIQSICDYFKLDLPFRRKASTYGVISEDSVIDIEVKTPKKSSCLYICQYCLVHLGDIARYRQQVDQAETFYWHAAYLIPVNGQPYNQLAILEASRGNKLQTVFHYVRSLALRCPFSVAATNLEKLYIKATKEKSEYKDKLSYSDYINAFIQLHGHIHLSSDIKKATTLSDHLITSLPTHITTSSPNNSSLTNTTLLQTSAITLYSLNAIRHDSDVKVNDLSSEEQLNYNVLFKFLANVLETLLAHTPKTEPKARESPTLPTIIILLEWLRLDTENFKLPLLNASTMWPHLAKLLNCVQATKTDDSLIKDTSKQDADIALPEDVMLRGFQPLDKVQAQYNYHRSATETLDSIQQNKTRCRRLVNYGTWVTQNHSSLLCIKEERNGRTVFTSPIPTVTFSSESPSPEKRGRQNVAMQAIMQNKHGSPDTTPSTSDTSLAESEGSSPDKNPTKYLLGMPMNPPSHHKSNSRISTHNTTPTLYNSKAPTTTKDTTSTTTTIKKSSVNLDDQPIQTSSQNPGLIQIPTKDLLMAADKSPTNTNKTPISGPKYYRNIAPRHRNKVPDSLQQIELEKHLEEKPFCANKESWPALGAKVTKPDIMSIGEFQPDPTYNPDQNMGTFQAEPHQVLHSMPQPGFPIPGVQMPASGLSIVRFPLPSGINGPKPTVIDAQDSGSHRYSRMNRGDSHTSQDSRLSDPSYQQDYTPDPHMAQMEYARQDTNNSNNLMQQSPMRLPIQIPNQSVLTQQNNIAQQPPLQQYPISPQIQFQQPRLQYHQDLRPQIIPQPYPPYPMNPLMTQDPQITQYQPYTPVEYPRAPPNPVTSFVDGPRGGIFPSMSFMVHNPPPSVLPTSQPGATPHMRIYGMDAAQQGHMQNGDGSHNYGTMPLARQTSQGETDKSGTYSLFSGGPWSVQISSAESKVGGVSPFVSNGGQVGPSPDPAPKDPLQRGPEWGPTVQESAGIYTNSGVPSNMQSLWNMPGPSPLQRLLEQQRQQRQTDPH